MFFFSGHSRPSSYNQNKFHRGLGQDPSITVFFGGVGKLYFVEDEDGFQIAAPSNFSLPNCLWVPGPKHMIDNIIGDVLERLGQFKHFQSCLKACTEACTNWVSFVAFRAPTGPLGTLDYGPFCEL